MFAVWWSLCQGHLQACLSTRESGPQSRWVNCVQVIFITSNKRQTLTKKTLPANTAHCDTRRDPRNFNGVFLCLHDNIYAPYSWVESCKPEWQQYQSACSNHRYKTKIHVTQLWHLGLLYLLFASYKETICLSIHFLLNTSISKCFRKTSLSSMERTETLMWFCKLFFWGGGHGGGAEVGG